MSKSKLLRELFRKPGTVRIAGAHNGMTAKLVEKAGFEGVWASGLEVSTSHAVPDANILTMTDYLEAANDMNDSVSIPLVVDVDTGYGNSNNVIHMVKKFEAAGIAAVIMEDKHFPKVNSFVPGRQELASIAEFVGKIVAGKNAQESKDFMIFARVEALIAGWGQEEALKRAKAYVEAGADGIFIHSKQKTPDEINEFIKRYDLAAPLVVCPTTYPDFTVEEAEKTNKVKMYIFANHGIRAAVKSVKETLSKLNKSNDIRTVDKDIAPLQEIFELQGMPQMKEAEKKYLRTGKVNAVALIPAAGDDSFIPSFKDLLQDRPLAMLDINGKSILQRTTEILNNSGIQDIRVITGYKKEAINVEGVKLIENKEYKQYGILHSVMEGLKDITEDVLIIYSDIVFDKSITDRLLTCKKDINLVIDVSYRTQEQKDKFYDLVVAERAPASGKAMLSCGKENPIKKIGRNVNQDEATHEFTGITFLSKKGIEIVKKEFAAIKNNKEINGVDCNKADFSDFLQELINKGIGIDSMQVAKGWMEIHTFDDYKKACEMLAE